MVVDKKTKSKYNDVYYNKYKDRLLQNMKNKIQCECGSSICKINLYRHIKTKKHQQFLNKKSAT